MKTALLLLALFAFVVVALLAAANSTWTSRTAEAVVRLDAGAVAPADSVFRPGLLDTLPPPVARYLRAVLLDGTPLARHAVVRHEGTFLAGASAAKPWPFSSVQHFDSNYPGFVWDARMRVVPGASVFVRDEFVNGQGAMMARVAGIYPVAHTHESPALDDAELQRWLAETAWFPTALLPGQAVRWEAIDDSTARAWVTAGAAKVSLDFHFGADSLVSYVRTETRNRDVAGVFVPTPWRGEWSDWDWYRGTRVPLQGEVAWLLPGGPFTYWRARVMDATYQ
jgi:hypothetical protein